MMFTFALALMCWPALWLWLSITNQDKPESHSIIAATMLAVVIEAFAWGLRLLIYSLTLPL